MHKQCEHVCVHMCGWGVIAGDWSPCFCGAINFSSTNWNSVSKEQAWAGLEEAAREGWTRVPIRENSIISWKNHKNRNSKCFPIRSSQTKHTQLSRDMVLCVLLPHTMCHENPELVYMLLPGGPSNTRERRTGEDFGSQLSLKVHLFTSIPVSWEQWKNSLMAVYLNLET